VGQKSKEKRENKYQNTTRIILITCDLPYLGGPNYYKIRKGVKQVMASLSTRTTIVHRRLTLRSLYMGKAHGQRCQHGLAVSKYRQDCKQDSSGESPTSRRFKVREASSEIEENKKECKDEIGEMVRKIHG